MIRNTSKPETDQQSIPTDVEHVEILVCHSGAYDALQVRWESAYPAIPSDLHDALVEQMSNSQSDSDDSPRLFFAAYRVAEPACRDLYAPSVDGKVENRIYTVCRTEKNAAQFDNNLSAILSRNVFEGVGDLPEVTRRAHAEILESARLAPVIGLPETIPFDDLDQCRQSLPDITPDMLPRGVWGAVESIADRLSLPRSMAAVPILARASALIGSSLEIRPKRKDTDYAQPFSLWGMVIADSGLYKSQIDVAISRLMDCIEKRDSIRQEELGERRAKLEWERKEINETHKRKTKDEKTLKRLREIDMEISKMPPPRTFDTSSTTSERAMELLDSGACPTGLAIVTDELMTFFRDIQKNHQSTARSDFNRMYDAPKRMTQSRVCGDRKVTRPCVSIFGYIQPNPLHKVITADMTANGSDGFWGRFQLIVNAESITPEIPEDLVPNFVALEHLQGVFDEIDQLATRQRGWGSRGAYETKPLGEDMLSDLPVDTPYLRMTPEASERVLQEHLIINDTANKLSRNLQYAMAEWTRKNMGFLPRLAGILYVLDRVGRKGAPLRDVPVEYVEQAIKWRRWLFANAKSVFMKRYSNVTATGVVSFFRAVRDGSNGKGLRQAITVNKLQKTGRAGLRDRQDAQEVIDLLCLHNFLITTKSPGIYTVHPDAIAKPLEEIVPRKLLAAPKRGRPAKTQRNT